MPTRYGQGWASRSADSEPDDRLYGDWSREELLRMDEKFCERMQKAIARGLERPPDGERRAA
jgi:hypothetical protein